MPRLPSVPAPLSVRMAWTLSTVLLALAAGCQSDSDSDSPPSGAAYSNIHPADYVGPKKCAECHAEHFENWQRHSHSRMNLNASEETVVGNFDDCRVDYGDGHVLFEHLDDQYFMTLFQNEQMVRRYRVTRTVGSRFTQMYIGIQTDGPEPPSSSVYSTEGKLPFGYWMKRACWTPESYFDTDRELEPPDSVNMSAGLSHSHKQLQWTDNCIYCHNTYPYQHRLYFGEGMGFPVEDIVVPGGVEIVQEWGPNSPEKLVTLGVSCESCHFGGHAHAVNNQPTSYVPRSPELKVVRDEDREVPSDPKDPYVLNSVCAQCHCAKISQYPNGAATWNSREALDMLSGGCRNAIKCTDCHNPHLPTDEGGLKNETELVATCLRCHEKYREPAEASRHSQHPSAANVSCLDCHMPKIVQGLEAVVRTHHIHSPTDEQMLRQGGPNACNLCHQDESIRWTVNKLKKGWGWSADKQLGWDPIYGTKRDRAVCDAWLDHKFPVVRLVAAEAMSRSPQATEKLPKLLGLLKESTTVNRMFGLFAVERVLGRRLSDDEYNPLGTQQQRDEQVDALLAEIQSGQLEVASKPTQSPPASLQEPDSLEKPD